MDTAKLVCYGFVNVVPGYFFSQSMPIRLLQDASACQGDLLVLRRDRGIDVLKYQN